MGDGKDGWQHCMRRRLVLYCGDCGLRGGKVRIISAGHDNLFCFVCLFVCDFSFSFLFCLCVD